MSDLIGGSAGEPSGSSLNSITTDTAWSISNLLTLDGGGIRGYWSLLVLQQLMVCIARLEQQIEGVQSSFHPESYPSNVSQVPLGNAAYFSPNLQQGPDASHLPEMEYLSSMYLPCHYFDYIGGSSTGGLIAIMLGRLRMTVLDCLQEYKQLGHKIFGHPRILHTLRLGLGTRSKYNTREVERVFKDVCRRRSERSDDDDVISFQSKTSTCKTFLPVYMKFENEGGVKEFVFRSYDCFPTQSLNKKSLIRTGSAPLVDNYGPAHQLHVWKVARAVAAAQLYFQPLTIDFGKLKGMTFSDIGYTETSNPTWLGIGEIKACEGLNRQIGCLVSVGTARHREAGHKEWIVATLTRQVKQLIHDASDPSKVHEDVKRDAASEGYPYFRLNPKEQRHNLLMDLDHCLPKYGNSPGSTTISIIEETFQTWLEESDARRTLQECAERLVQIRQCRSRDTRRWARYALGAEWKCHSWCSKGPFADPEEHRDHMDREHQERGPEVTSKWQYNFEYNPGNEEEHRKKNEENPFLGSQIKTILKQHLRALSQRIHKVHSKEST